MAPINATDIATARKIADGDAVVTERFFVTHYASLYRFMRQLTGHREDAEDLTQQAFIKAKQQIDSYRGKAVSTADCGIASRDECDGPYVYGFCQWKDRIQELIRR